MWYVGEAFQAVIL